jgi:hypothetical protein
MGCSCRGFPDRDIADGVTVIVDEPCGVWIAGSAVAVVPPPPSPPSFALKHFQEDQTKHEQRQHAHAQRGTNRGAPKIGAIAAPLVATLTVNGDGAPFASGTQILLSIFYMEGKYRDFQPRVVCIAKEVFARMPFLG